MFTYCKRKQDIRLSPRNQVNLAAASMLQGKVAVLNNACRNALGAFARIRLSFVRCEPVWEADDTKKIATRHLSKAEIHVKNYS